MPIVIASQVGSLCQQMLYLRRLAMRIGMEPELAPEQTAEPKWYPYRFKNGPGPALCEGAQGDAPSPIFGNGKKTAVRFHRR